MPPSVSAQRQDLLRLARSRGLVYPIATKEEFVRQLSTSREPIVFRDASYDPVFAASLIPEFFFPVDSEDDLLERSLELLMARGLLPLQPHTDPVGLTLAPPEGK